MQAHKNYELLLQIIPDINTRTEAGKSVVDPDGGLMDLNLDVLHKEGDFIRIALSHYYKQNGDMIADPDMVFIINTQLKTVNAVTFQDSMIYQTAEVGDGKFNTKLIEQLNDFTGIWLQNCIDQGHLIS